MSLYHCACDYLCVLSTFLLYLLSTPDSTYMGFFFFFFDLYMYQSMDHVLYMYMYVQCNCFFQCTPVYFYMTLYSCIAFSRFMYVDCYSKTVDDFPTYIMSYNSLAHFIPMTQCDIYTRSNYNCIPGIPRPAESMNIIKHWQHAVCSETKVCRRQAIEPLLRTQIMSSQPY